MAGANHHEDGQVQARPAGIDQRPAAFQNTRVGQLLQPPPAGILRQADAVGQGALRQRRILLQRREDAVVDIVELRRLFVHLNVRLGVFPQRRNQILHLSVSSLAERKGDEHGFLRPVPGRPGGARDPA